MAAKPPPTAVPMRARGSGRAPPPLPCLPGAGIWPFEEFVRLKNIPVCPWRGRRRVNNRTVISFPPRFLIFLLSFPYLKKNYIYLFTLVLSFLFLPKSVWSPVHLQPCQDCL